MLWLLVFLNLLADSPISALQQQPTVPQEHDTLVNYCALLHAGYDYGQLFAMRKKQLSPEDVDTFNMRWQEVFNLPLYQAGITQTEFVMGSRFSEGNQDAFPPSSLYAPENPDTYMVFHLAKEIGMVQSAGFRNCPSCVDQSIAKTGAYLEVTPLYKKMSEQWSYLGQIPRIRTAQEVDTLWNLLNCTFANLYVDPKNADALNRAIPQIQCADTITVHAFKDISRAFEVVWLTCDAEGVVKTQGPVLVRGRARKRHAIYRMRISAETACGRAFRDQYFIIE